MDQQEATSASNLTRSFYNFRPGIQRHQQCSESEARRIASTLARLDRYWIMKGKRSGRRFSAQKHCRAVIKRDTKPNKNSHTKINEKVKLSEEELTLLVAKVLTKTDVSNLSRIVLPKKETEKLLSNLGTNKVLSLQVEDFESDDLWHLTLRYWKNNKSEMYVLENTGEFIERHNLCVGDHMLLYIHSTGKYVIKGERMESMTLEEKGRKQFSVQPSTMVEEVKNPSNVESSSPFQTFENISRDNYWKEFRNVILNDKDEYVSIPLWD